MLLLSEGKTKQIDLIRQKNYKKALEDTPSTRNPVDLIILLKQLCVHVKTELLAPFYENFIFVLKYFASAG